MAFAPASSRSRWSKPNSERPRATMAVGRVIGSCRRAATIAAAPGIAVSTTTTSSRPSSATLRTSSAPEARRRSTL